MEFFKRQTNIPFMRLKKVTTVIALIMCIGAAFLLITKGLNYGLEFTGGTQIELRFNSPISIEQAQQVLENGGFAHARTQHYGSTQDVLVRIANVNGQSGTAETQLQDKIAAAFANDNIPMEVRRIEFVGSEVGQQLAVQGGMAVVLAILATMAYIVLRFEYRFAISAALGLAHDALLVLGIFVLFDIEFDLAALAAILAVVGYSLNDKIVVFDRVRENFRVIREGSAEDIMNGAINQTLSRTIMTSVLTLLVVLALLFFGGESLFSFSLALTLGIVIGTYSSIYVASALAILFGLSRKDLLPKPKAMLDDMP